jgi:hypothetical protein
MALRDYQVPREEVVVNETTTFSVEGISFNILTSLVNTHGPAMTVLFGQFAEKKSGGIKPEDIGLLVKLGMDRFPALVGDIIAHASGELTGDRKEDAKLRDGISRLPVGPQLDAIEKIIRLTFTTESDVKKLVETVTRMAQSVQTTVGTLTAPTLSKHSSNGSGAFAVR